MRIIRLAEISVRRWWLLCVFVVLGLGVAQAWRTNVRESYESIVTLQLNPAGRSAFLPYSGDQRGEPANMVALVASYAEVLHSRAFGELVVERLASTDSPERISGAIATRLVPNTNILRLVVSWDNPQDAQRIAQAVAETFVSENARGQAVQQDARAGLADMEATLRTTQERLSALGQLRDRLDQAVSGGELWRAPELTDVEDHLATLQSSRANLLIESNRMRSSLRTASIMDNASPGQVAGTSRSLALLTGLLGGLATGVVLAVLLDRLEDRVRTPGDVVSAGGDAPLVLVETLGARNRVGALPDARLATLG